MYKTVHVPTTYTEMRKLQNTRQKNNTHTLEKEFESLNTVFKLKKGYKNKCIHYQRLLLKQLN